MADFSRYFPSGESSADYSSYFPSAPAGAGAPTVPGAVSFGPESMKASIKEEAGTRSGLDQALAGVGTRVNDAAMRLKQLFGNELTPQETADVRAGRQLRQVSTPAMLGGIGGDVAMTYPVAPARLVGNVLAGGAISGATEPVLEGESTVGNIARGAVGQGAGYGVVKGLQHAAQPIAQSAPVRQLLDEGIVPTLGQAARSARTLGGRMVGGIEDAATSIPLLGNVIGGARSRATGELQQAALRRATPQGTAVAQGPMREAIEETASAVSDAYRVALDRIGTVRVDTQFLNSAPQIVQRAVALNPAQRADVSNVVDQIISSRVNPAGGAVPAQVAKTIDSDLGAYARDYSRSSVASERQMAGVIREIQGQWRDLITRSAPDAETARVLADANRAHANLLRVERASTKSATAGGEFTPGQLNQAVREMTPNKRQFARGGALMQDLSEPAATTLTGRLGESGTIPRGIIGLGVLGGGGAYANEQAGGPDWLTNLAIATAMSGPLYSRAGSRYALGELLPSVQQPAARALEAMSPYGGLIGRSYLMGQGRL